MAVILEVTGLKKSFGKKQAIDHLSFHVQENEIVGFIGPNGAGKSTVMKCIAGLYYPDEGTITIGDYDVVKERAKAMCNVGVSIESPALYPQLSGHDHFKMVAGWRGLSKERITEMEAFSGLHEHLKRKTANYSMGMKQRLMLALVMMDKPKLLMLDEPMNGLDPQAVFELREKLLEIKKSGSSILLSSHQLDEVEKIADRVIFIRDGKILAMDDMKSFRKQRMRYAMKVSNQETTLQILKEHDLASTLAKDRHYNYDDTEHILFEVVNEEGFASVLNILHEQQIHIYQIHEVTMDLESLYRELYEKE